MSATPADGLEHWLDIERGDNACVQMMAYLNTEAGRHARSMSPLSRTLRLLIAQLDMLDPISPPISSAVFPGDGHDGSRHLNTVHDRADEPPAAPGFEDEALLALLRLLSDRGYQFVTPTPATHARVLARPDRQQARTLRDVLGWSLPFRRGEIDLEVEALLGEARVLRHDGMWLRSEVRVSSLHGRLFLHSAYPTSEADAVFFGPDSYRFADLILAELTVCPEQAGAKMLDIGTGSGVGAIISSLACPGGQVAVTDINPNALRHARINVAAAGVEAAVHLCATLDPVAGEFDVVTANPPFIVDADSRLYRDGGGMHGAQISIDMARMALDRLARGGRLILYTGSAIVDGEDGLRRVLGEEAAAREFGFRYRELDPDIFGEELDQPAYRQVERIALVAAVVTRPGGAARRSR